MCNYILLFSTIYTFTSNLLDLWANNFDCHFSQKTLDMLRLKDTSLIRKLIPFREGEVKDKKGNTYSYRYCLKIRAIPYLISIIILMFLLPLAILNMIYNIIPATYIYIASAIIVLVHLLRETVISICSQGLGL